MWRKDTPHVLHVHIAPRRHKRCVIRAALEWLLLERENAPGHAATRVDRDGDAPSQVLAAASPANRLPRLFVE